MVNHCAVPGCHSNRGRLSKRITVFRIPQDLELREQWRKIIGIKEFKACHRICSKHFQEQDIIRCSEYFDTAGNCIYKVSLPYPRLKKSAIPFLTQDEAQEIAALNVRKRAKTKNHGNNKNVSNGSTHSPNSDHAVQEICTTNENVTSQTNVTFNGGIADAFKVIPISTQPVKLVDQSKVIPIPAQLIIISQVNTLPIVNSFPESQGTEIRIIQSNKTNEPEVMPSASQSNNNNDHDYDSRPLSEVSDSPSIDSFITSTLEPSSPQEPAETHIEFVREFTPIDIFSQLLLCLDKLKLPPNWFIKSSLEEGYVSLFEMHINNCFSETDNTSPLVLRRIILVDSNMSVSYFVLGFKLPDAVTLGFLQTLDNIDELQHLLESFNSHSLCNGISDTANVIPIQNECTQIDQLGFLRHKSCEWMSITKRCTQCAKGLKTIVQKKRRIRKRESRVNGNNNESNHFTKFTIEDWKRKNATLRVALVRKNNKIESLKQTIRELKADF